MTRMSVDDRRAALLDAAVRVIASHGVHAATTRAIVAEAGMPLASFHYAYRSRNELMRELISLVVDQTSTAVFSALHSGSDIRTAVRDGLQGYFDHLKADPGREQVMFELQQFALRTEGFEDLARGQYETYHRAAAEVLEVGCAAANVRWSAPLADIARLLVTLTDGITLAWLADRDDAAATRSLDLAADALAALAVPLAAPRAQPSTQTSTATATIRSNN